MTCGKLGDGFPAPWSQLKVLNLSCLRLVHDFPAIFPYLTSLERLSIDIMRFYAYPSRWPAYKPNVTLELLHTFSFICSDSVWPYEWLESVRFPALKEFSLEERLGSTFDWPLQAVTKLADCAQGLEEFYLTRIDLSPFYRETRRILSLMPNLRVLMLDGVSANPYRILKMLFKPSHVPQESSTLPLLPRLEILRIDHHDWDAMDEIDPCYIYWYILTFLIQRLQTTPFREFSLTWSTYQLSMEEMPMEKCHDDIRKLANLIKACSSYVSIEITELQEVNELAKRWMFENGICMDYIHNRSY
ncbi:hypothetical protein EV122DRAFT_286483 [Schizophyllum commune]